jgi:YebC/PmpR family DNA-binding regulatory protein
MGAQWKHAGRLAAAAKKGAQFGKYVKEIQVAARMGNPDPNANARLRAAIEAAKKVSVPRDTIERAIKKGAGLLDDQSQFETVVYEGFAPHRVPVIVECLTDNKNRSASDMRVLFRKGQLGNAGSVAWMFDRVGVVEATFGGSAADLEGVAIEAGAQDFEPLEAEEAGEGHQGGRFFTEVTDLNDVSEAIHKMGWTVTKSELIYKVKAPVALADDAMKEVVEFLQNIDDNDDVHRVYPGIA